MVRLQRKNDSFKEICRILSLGRYKDNGERAKLSTEMGFKHTLVALDAVLVECPQLISVVREAQYQIKVDKRVKEVEQDEMKVLAKENAHKHRQLKRFEANQERWLHSKDFLSRGDIAEKDMLYLRPITEQLAWQRVSQSRTPLIKNTIPGKYFSRMPGSSKKFLVNLLENQEKWYDMDHSRNGTHEQQV